MPTPSIGSPAAISTGTMVMIEPPGMPGTENVANSAVTAIVSNCEGPRVMP